MNFKNLFGLFKEHGNSQVIISPGSRNAPLVEAFTSDAYFQCYSIIDERSAAFYALGIAQQNDKAAILVCTSGSAALNYAAAIAEAYYQGVGLIVLTADRPKRLIDQQEGQSIRQENLFQNFVKASFNFPASIDRGTDFHYASRIINEACVISERAQKGPVHINIPLEEPLYGRPDSKEQPRVFKEYAGHSLSKSQLSELEELWDTQQKVMILCAQFRPNQSVHEQLLALKEKNPGMVVLTESLSNTYHPSFINCIDRVIDGLSDLTEYTPDILISIGDNLVSKKMKQFIRKSKPSYHWSIKESEWIEDTYQALSHKIRVEPAAMLQSMLSWSNKPKNSFTSIWDEQNELRLASHQAFAGKTAFSDFSCFDSILQKVPSDFQIQYGNSTVVRYAQLFESARNNPQFGNRGTSGIDGCTSTAVGAAAVSDNPVLLISGDVSFQYDSNAFLNNYVSPNLRVIVLNNAGGNIFKIIEGPEKLEKGREFLESPHKFSAEALANRASIEYRKAKSKQELDKELESFFKLDSNKTVLLEIFTNSDLSADTLKSYFNYLNSDE